MKGLGGIFSWLYDIISMVLLEGEQAAYMKSVLSKTRKGQIKRYQSIGDHLTMLITKQGKGKQKGIN